MSECVLKVFDSIALYQACIYLHIFLIVKFQSQFYIDFLLLIPSRQNHRYWQSAEAGAREGLNALAVVCMDIFHWLFRGRHVARTYVKQPLC